MIRRVLMSPRIAGLKEHRGEIVGEATWPPIIR
jgi:site-specific DNA recombinase